MADEYEFGSVDFITVGTIGPPGQRVFHLQAKQDNDLLTLIIEKEQASALADTIIALNEKIQEDLGLTTDEVNLQQFDLDLQEPILPVFRVAQMGLGYDDDEDVLILVVSELLPEDAVIEPRSARIVATRTQMQMLALHTQIVVGEGRPICGNCGRPIDPDGHFCPKSNGHRKHVAASG
jgi:uncharacterized repeat protein (TIGR03847 family)